MINYVIVLLIVLLLGFVVYMLFLFRKNQKHTNQNDRNLLETLHDFKKSLRNEIDDQKKDLIELKELTRSDKRWIDSPLKKLSFDETMDLTKLGNEIRNNELMKCSNQLVDACGLSISKGVQLVDSIKKAEDGQIVWELSKKGKKLLKNGELTFTAHKKTGKLLPVVKNSKGRFKELIKGAKPSHVAKAAKLANVAVNAAHIIAGVDQMNKLKEIDKKISFLVEGRKIDKLGKLRANFRVAKEIFSQPMGIHERAQLISVHKELIELREIWFSEIEYKLINIKDPKNAAFFKKTFTSAKSNDMKINKKISAFQKEVDYINASLIIDSSICYGIKYNSSIDVDLIKIENIKKLMNEKRDFLSGKTNINIDSDLSKLELMKKYYLNIDPLMRFCNLIKA